VKDLIFLVGFLASVPIGTLLASLSRRLRDLVFLVLLAGTTKPGLLDINFFSREWYRGTTRGIEVSYLDLLVLILLFSTLLDGQRRPHRFFWPASLGLMLLYFLYSGLSLLGADPQLFGLFEWTKILRGILVFITVAYYVQGERELKLLLFAFCAAMGYEALVSLQQRYLLHGYRIAGSFDHANTLSMYCCILMPLFVAAALSNLSLSLRALFGACALMATACTILSISRMGFATLMLVAVLTFMACFEFRFNQTNMIMLVVVSVAIAGMTYKAWDSLSSRYSERSLEEEYGEDSEGRGIYLRLAGLISRDHFFGVGLNNWSYWVTQEYAAEIGLVYRPYIGTDDVPDQTIPEGSRTNGAQAAPAHNLFVLTLGELGWPGLIIFSCLWLRWLWMGAVFLVKRKTALVSRFCTGAFFAILAGVLQSMTEWAYRQTALFFLLNIIAGALAAMYVRRNTPAGYVPPPGQGLQARPRQRYSEVRSRVR